MTTSELLTPGDIRAVRFKSHTHISCGECYDAMEVDAFLERCETTVRRLAATIRDLREASCAASI